MAKKINVANKIIEGLTEFTEALESGAKISEQFTCRKVVLDLHPVAYTRAAVRSTRKVLGVSQALFAQFLGVSVKAVRSWEQGRQSPSDMACRFLDEINRNPSYWRKRLRESIVVA